MSRSTLRIVAVIVLALLGAPVAMHVVMHDLHAHHDGHADVFNDRSGHGDHEHPVVSSSAPPVPSLARAALMMVPPPRAMSAASTGLANAPRNLVAFGALRIDPDVGLQPLLSTFLI